MKHAVKEKKERLGNDLILPLSNSRLHVVHDCPLLPCFTFICSFAPVWLLNCRLHIVQSNIVSTINIIDTYVTLFSSFHKLFFVTELSRLHEIFVIVPTDKASNNYTFVCKRYYVDILIEELGLHLLPGNPTHNLTDFSASEVLDNHKSVLTCSGIQTTDEELDLPYIYWIPKMHKNPYNTGSLQVPRSGRHSLCPFYSQNCLHILSKVFRSTAKHPTPEVGSIRCGS